MHVVDLRKTVTCHGLCVVEPVYIRPCGAADGGTGGELRGRASLVTVDVLTGHICSVSLCLCVPTERDKYVWLVESRRRPVDRDLEGGLTRQCNTRLSFLIMCFEPDTGKPCENSLKTHLIVAIEGTCLV